MVGPVNVDFPVISPASSPDGEYVLHCQDSNLKNRKMEKPQRGTDRSMCKADTGTKALRSEKKVLCKTVARGPDSGQAQSQPARSLPGLCLQQSGEGCGGMKPERWAGPSCYGPWKPCKGVRRKEREVRKRRKAQAYCADSSGFKSQRKGNVLAGVTGKCRDLTTSSGYSFSFLTPHTHLLCWFSSLTASFHMLASGSSSFVMNR